MTEKACRAGALWRAERKLVFRAARPERSDSGGPGGTPHGHKISGRTRGGKPEKGIGIGDRCTKNRHSTQYFWTPPPGFRPKGLFLPIGVQLYCTNGRFSGHLSEMIERAGPASLEF